MKRRLLTTVSVFLVLVTIWQLHSRATQQSTLRTFMQRKLDLSKDILEGLALEDFEKVAKSAQEVSLMSQESGWNVITTPTYLEYSGDFRRAAAAIQRAAQRKNVEAATLGYVDLTMRCVECHTYLRSQKLGPRHGN